MEKIAVWSDYDWCWIDCLDDYLSFKSDDYKIVFLPAFMYEPTFEFIKRIVDGIYAR